MDKVKHDAEMSYIAHCRDFLYDLANVGNWIEWGVFKEAAATTVQLVIALVIVVLLPVSAPLLALMRQRAAKARYRREVEYDNRWKDRMQSRMQKAQK